VKHFVVYGNPSSFLRYRHLVRLNLHSISLCIFIALSLLTTQIIFSVSLTVKLSSLYVGEILDKSILIC
jgi:hypothetical protein